MTISPFSFRELGGNDAEIIATARPKSFLPTGRKKEEAASPPPPPPPPVFSEDEVKAAERDSYQKGFLDGVMEGKNQAQNIQADIDKALGEMVAGWLSYYNPLFTLYRDMLAAQAKMLPELALGIAKKVAGTALTADAGRQIEDICLRALKTLAHEPKLIIIIHDSLAETLRAKIAAAKPAGEVEVVADQNIAPPNCRIEWKNGAMTRDIDALWQQVDQVMASMVASAEREANALCDTLKASQENIGGEPNG